MSENVGRQDKTCVFDFCVRIQLILADMKSDNEVSLGVSLNFRFILRGNVGIL